MVKGLDLLGEFFLENSKDELIVIRFESPVKWKEESDKEELVESVYNKHKVEQVNKAFLERHKIPPEKVIGGRLSDLPGFDPSLVKKAFFDVFENKSISLEHKFKIDSKTPYYTKDNYTCCYNSEGDMVGVVIVERDITDEKISEQILSHQKEVLEKIAREDTGIEILNDICKGINTLKQGVKCAVLGIRKDKTLEVLGAPDFPKSFREYMQGKDIKTDPIPSAMAANSGSLVIVKEIKDSSLPFAYKQLVEKLGLYAVCAAPVFDNDKEVIAVFAVYSRTENKPFNIEMDLVESSRNLVEIALKRVMLNSQSEEQRKLLIKSETFYRSVVQNGSDVFAIINHRGVISYLSPSVKGTFGYEEEELLNTSIFDCILKDDLPFAYTKLEELLLHGTLPKFELRMKHKSGKILCIESKTCFRVPDNPELGFILSGWDITERKKQEEKLIEMEQEQAKAKALFQKLAESTPDFIVIWDIVNQRPLYFNKKDFHGINLDRDSEKILNIDIVHPDDREKVLKHREELRRSKYQSPIEIEYRVKFRGNDYDWVDNRYSVMEVDKLGNPLLLLVCVTIVTDKRKALETVEKNRVKLLALIENTDSRIWSINRNYEFTIFNTVFQKYYKMSFGVDPKIGESAFLHSSEKETTFWKSLYDSALEGKRVLEEATVEVGEDKIYYDLWLNPILNGKVEIEGVSCFLIDVSERKQTENELKKANFELDSFVYRASHDMMAPLRSILGLVEIVRMEQNKEEQGKFLDLIEKSVNKLDVFIKDLTAFSRNSRLPTISTSIDFKKTIEATVQDLAFMTNAGRLDIHINVDQNSDFYSDEARIDIIFHNLISNAIKYQRLHIDDPKLWIEVKSSEKEAVITVKDNGKGIREEYLDKIFEMFFRASEESYGSGLGLYIVKQVVEKLSGKILKVESKIGEGTSFTITLPNIKGQDIVG